jgi:hypothetical protein
MQTEKRIATHVSNLALRLWSEAAVLAMIAMELTWITAWYKLTTRPQAGLGMTILILALALTGSYASGRAMSALHWRLGLRRVAFLAWLVLTTFFSLKLLLFPQAGRVLSGLITQPINAILSGQWGAREFWHVLVICLLGLRGVSLATTTVEQHNVLASLQLGMLMFLLYGLGMSAANPVGTAVIFFIFLAFGMLSLSAVGIAGISDLRGGRLPRLNWTWTTGILASAFLVAGIGVLSGWWLSGKQVATFLGQIVMGTFNVLLVLIALVISPLVFLLYWIITSVTHWMSGLIDPKGLNAFLQSLKVMNGTGQDQATIILNSTAARNIIMGSAVAAVIIITLIIIRRQPRKRRLVAEEDSLSIGANRRAYTPGKIGKDRSGWLNPRRLLAAAQVRRIYALLMDLCEKLGHARPAALTPLEFLPTLRQIFPEGVTQVSLITNAYVRVRYGELPETDTEVKELRQAWNWLKNHKGSLF